jgi:hypothetical protein
MLYPPRLREMLGKFFLGDGNNGALFIKDDGT